MVASSDANPSTETLCEAVVGAVLDTLPGERDFRSLAPLQEAIDVDALEQLLSHAHTACSVSFRYAEYNVLVTEDGSVAVSPIGSERIEQETD